MSKTPFEILGISKKVSFAEFLVTAVELPKKYDPKKHDDAAVREVMEEKSKEISEAIKVITQAFEAKRVDGHYPAFIYEADLLPAVATVPRTNSTVSNLEDDSDWKKKYNVRSVSAEELRAVAAAQKASNSKGSTSGFAKFLAYIFIGPFIIILTVLQVILSVTSNLIKTISTILILLWTWYLYSEREFIARNILIFGDAYRVRDIEPTIFNNVIVNLTVYFGVAILLLTIRFGYSGIIKLCQGAREKFQKFVRQ